VAVGPLFALGARVGDKPAARGETLAVAESSAGGLISAALLSRAGASVYYFGGAVLYTRRSRRLPWASARPNRRPVHGLMRRWPQSRASASGCSRT